MKTIPELSCDKRHERQELPFWPLVVNTLGLAERTFQGIRRDDAHPRGDADGVLDEGRNLLGIGRQTLYNKINQLQQS